MLALTGTADKLRPVSLPEEHQLQQLWVSAVVPVIEEAGGKQREASVSCEMLMT